MITTVLRTIVVYLFLILSMRMMGKRQIGELQLSELVTTLMLSELATLPITDAEIPLSHTLIPILLLLSLEILLSYLATRISCLKKLINGATNFLIQRGTINYTELKKARLSIEELLSEIRQKGYSGIDDVYYAILEQNGKISIFPKEENNVPKNKELGIKAAESGIEHLLICDGKRNSYNMKFTDFSEKRLMEALNNANINNEKDVFIMTVNDAGEIQIIKKENTV